MSKMDKSKIAVIIGCIAGVVFVIIPLLYRYVRYYMI